MSGNEKSRSLLAPIGASLMRAYAPPAPGRLLTAMITAFATLAVAIGYSGAVIAAPSTFHSRPRYLARGLGDDQVLRPGHPQNPNHFVGYRMFRISIVQTGRFCYTILSTGMLLGYKRA